MICPFAVYRPVVNHGGGMTAINGLCLHVQVGNNSLYNYFNSPSAGVSSHFWAAKSGLLEQYVDTDIVAWAQAAGNPYYLSVETEGFPNEPLTDKQLTTLGRLLQWSAITYNFPMTGPTAHGSRGFTQHCNPNGTPDPAWGNHTCPDPLRMGQMPTIIRLATATPPTGKEAEEMAHWQAGGQDHVSGVIGDKAYHWWQQTPTGDPNHPADPEWHVEVLPMPQ